MKKFLLSLTTLFVGMFIFLGGGVTLLEYNQNKAHAFYSNVSTYDAIKVGEIWNDVGFDKTNLDKLLQLVSGNTSVSTSNMSTINTQATSKRTSKQMRETAVSSLGKTTYQDIIVTFGGLDWGCAYLSTDKSGNAILTLWLANCEQLSGKKYTTKTFDSYGRATWNSGYTVSTDTGNSTYPDNMYGVSYMRSVVLNNGGKYKSSNTTGTTLTSYTKRSDSAFANFTMPVTGAYNDITDFIVTPANVSWQEKGQSVKTRFSGLDYDLSNENWSQTITNSTDYPYHYSFSDNTKDYYYNYSGKSKNDTWKDDCLWLPSISEIGYGYSGGTYHTNAGIWDVSINQCINGNPTSDTTYAQWLRTEGHLNEYNDKADWIIFISGNGYTLTPATIDHSYSVRPALHLNLTAAAAHTAKPISSCTVGSIASRQWNPVTSINSTIPDLVVKDGSTQLVKGTDYTVAFTTGKAPTAPGTVNLTITGTGDYAGTLSASYTLTKRDIRLALRDNNLTIPNKTYTGSAQTHTFSLRDYGYLDYSSSTPGSASGIALSTSYYRVTYTNNTNVGTAYVTIAGYGTYYDSTTSTSTTFTITQESLSDSKNVTFTLSKTSVEYNFGEELYAGKVTPSLKIGTKTLTLNTDYIISLHKADGTQITSITDIGTYIVRATGKGNCTGTKDVTFTVTQATIKSTDITLSPTSYAYTGTQIKPSFTFTRTYVTGKTYYFIEGEDYTATYGDNINIGTSKGSVVLTGIDKFKGTVTKTFTITAKSITSEDIIETPITVQPYTGSALTPDVTLVDTSIDRVLVKNTDYTLTYTNNIAMGEATVTITGKGNYTGTRITSFTIGQRDIALASIASIPDQTYTGTNIEPTLTITDNGKTLVKGTDYIVSFENNINVTTPGGAVVSISGRGGYIGTNSTVFTIVPANLTGNASIILTPSSSIYTGNSLIPEINVSMGGKPLADSNFDVSYVLGNVNIDEMVDTGIYTIRITGKGNYIGTAQENFIINPCDITEAVPSAYVTSFLFDKTVHKPTINLTYGNLTLQEGTDFNISYRKTSESGAVITDPIDADTYYMILTGVNNYTGTVTDMTFVINPINLNTGNIVVTYNRDLETDLTFNNKDQKISLLSLKINDIELFGASSDGNANNFLIARYYRDDSQTNDFKSAGNIIIKIIPINSNVIGEYEVSYTIKRKDLLEADTNKELSITGINNKTYNGNKHSLNIDIVDEGASDYDLTINDFTISYSTDCIEANDNIIITISATRVGNYRGEITRSFKILKAVVNTFELLEDRGVYNENEHTISAIVKAGSMELNSTQYRLKFDREDFVPADLQLINAGNIEVSIILLDNTNFELSSSLSSRIYTISSAEISSITLTENNIEFDSKNHTIKISNVSSKNGLTLAESDYTATYNELESSTFRNAGTIIVKVTGIGNFMGSATAQFKITPREIRSNEIKYFLADENGDYINIENPKEIDMNGNYKGERVAPFIRMNIDESSSDDGYVLVRGTDYDFAIYTLDDYLYNEVNKTNLFGTTSASYLVVGEYVFEIIGKGNFTNIITKNYKVNLADFNPTTIGISVIDKVYNGRPVEFDFDNNEAVITYTRPGSTTITLKKGIDFDLFDGYIEITLKEGTNEIENVTIVPADQVESKKDDENVFLVKNGYVNNNAAGTATLVITGKSANFESGTVVTKQFNIAQVKLDNENTTITGISATYEYTGFSIVPELSVFSKVLNKNLVLGTDFEITYLQNYKEVIVEDDKIEISGIENNIDVGIVTIIISGINGFSGSITLKDAFKIVQKSISNDMFEFVDSKVYNGISQKPLITSSYGDKVMKEGEDYNVSYKRGEETTENFISVGVINIEFTGIGNFKGNIIRTFTISKQIIKEITLNKTFVTFTGYDQKPTIIVKDQADNTLVEDTDYILKLNREGNDWTSAGTITISVDVLEDSNYKLGTELSAIFTINKASLSLVMATIPNQSYTGLGIRPDFTLKFGSYTLTQDEFEIISFKDNVDLGTATIALRTLDKNFEGSTEITFQIVQKDISEDDVTLGNYKSEVFYNGTYQAPSFTINYLHNILVVNRDYDFEIIGESGSSATESDFTNVGEYSIKITGKGNYTGSKESVSYKISPRDLSTCSVNITLSDLIDLIYSGTSLEPAVVEVKASFAGFQEELESGIDYNAPIYENSVNAGTATVKIEGKGNFTGIARKNYQISRKALNQSMLKSINSKSYTGKIIVFDNEDISLIYNSKNLTLNDYEVSYTTQPIKVGTHSITISGRGNFSGNLESSFDIIPLNLKDAEITFDSDDFNVNTIIYTGKDLKQIVLGSINIDVGEVKLPLGTDVVLIFDDITQRGQIDKGKKTFTIEPITGNVIGIKSSFYEIISKDLEDEMLSITTENVSYTGSNILLEYNLTYNGIQLVKDKDYTESYVNNKNANVNSTEKAVLTITGIGNFNESIIYEFVINKAKSIVNIETPEKKLFVGESVNNNNLSLTLKEGSTEGTIALTSAIEFLSANSNTVSWQFMPNDANNYEMATGEYELFAVYYVSVSFGNTIDILAGPNTEIPVNVKVKIQDTLTDLSKERYKVIITLLGEEPEKNKIVNDFMLGGNYEIKVELVNSKDYSIETQSSIRFYAQPTIIFSADGQFYAVCETGFEDGVELVVDEFELKDDVIKEIGEDNYNKLSNIVKVYLPKLYKNGTQLENYDGIKLYFKASSNDYYASNENNLSNLEIKNQDIELVIGSYLIVVDEPFNFLIIIIIGIILILLIILLIVVRAILKRKKNKQNTSIDISKLKEQNNFNMNNNGQINLNRNFNNGQQNMQCTPINNFAQNMNGISDSQNLNNGQKLPNNQKIKPNNKKN